MLALGSSAYKCDMQFKTDMTENCEFNLYTFQKEV